MNAQTSEVQESRKAQIAGAVTPTEKEAVERVKRETGRDASNLLREYSLQQLIDWGGALLVLDRTQAQPSTPAAIAS